MKRRQFIQQATAAFGASALGVTRAATVLTGSPGVTDNEIRIGQSAVLSGPSANLGLEMKAGVEACFKAVNDRGGIGGRMLRLLTLDDRYEPERCAANTAKLITGERAFALLGYVGTPTCNAALPVFTASKVPFIGAFTGAICGLIGVGGTNLVVPYLMQRNAELRTAVGTASALQIPAALMGTAAYFLLGGGGLSAFGDVGYVRMPVVAVLAAAALLFAPLGVRAGHWLPVPTLRKVFGAFTGLVGLKMLGLFPL